MDVKLLIPKRSSMAFYPSSMENRIKKENKIIS
jgi:hypothetical protein